MNCKIRSGLAIGIAFGLGFSSLGMASSYAQDEAFDGNAVFKTFVGENLDKETNKVFVGENVRLVVTLNNFEQLLGMDNAIKWDPEKISLMTLDDNKESFVEFNGYNAATDANMDPIGYLYYETDTPKCSYQYGFGINGEFIDSGDFEQIINNRRNLPMVDTDNGKFALSWNFRDNVAISEEIEYLSMVFKTKKAGMFDVKFSKDVIKSIQGINAAAIGDDGALVLKVDITELSTNIVEKPDDPTEVKWDGYNATWESGENRGFIVQLYKDGVKFGDAIDVEQDKKSYDFTEAIKAVKESAEYKYTVVAKGGDFDSGEASSDVKEVNLQLEKPSAPVWNGTKLTWDNVDENVQTYAIQLYKDGVKFGDTILVDEPSVNKEMELAEKFTEPGAYSATVTAKASGYSDSEESDKTNTTYNTGSTITGTYTIYDGLDESANHPKFNLPDNFSISLFDGNIKVAEATIENNEFTFEKVPEGKYTLKITGDWILDREYEFSVMGDANYSISRPIEFTYGDLTGDGAINVSDIAEIKKFLNSTDGKYHFINNGKTITGVAEFGHIVRVYVYEYDLESIVLE